MPMSKCFQCEAETTKNCPICTRPFCDDHSGHDGDLCQDCCSTEDNKVEKTIGVTDEEGVEHKDVTQIRPVGPFYISTTGAIAQMSDAELERFYNRYTMLVKDCEAAIDRYRIVKSAIFMEQEERQRAKIREARAWKAAPTRDIKEVAKSVERQPTDLKLAIFAALLKRSGITADKLKEMIQTAKEKKGNEPATTA